MPRPLEYDEWEDDDECTMPCPHCKKLIYDDTEQCPHCRQYISREDEPRETKPLWIIVGFILCLGAVAWWIWHV